MLRQCSPSPVCHVSHVCCRWQVSGARSTKQNKKYYSLLYWLIDKFDKLRSELESKFLLPTWNVQSFKDWNMDKHWIESYDVVHDTNMVEPHRRHSKIWASFYSKTRVAELLDPGIKDPKKIPNCLKAEGCSISELHDIRTRPLKSWEKYLWFIGLVYLQRKTWT